jgi:diguanylate cyclase (GGDEF)-like protein
LNKLSDVLAQQGLPDFLQYTLTAIVLIDGQGRMLDWNPAFEQRRAARQGATSLQELVWPTSQDRLGEMLKTKKVVKSSLELLPLTEKFEYQCLMQPLADGEFLFFAEPAVKARDVELAHLADTLRKTRRDLENKQIDLESVLAQADEVSHTDALTFLSNRKRIVADIQRDVAASDRYHKPLTIFMVDIDHFKQVNDTYGHSAGDQVLRTMANGMQTSIREIDKLGRYGGDEFLFLLPATTIKSSLKMADRLLEVARTLPIPLDHQQILHLSISIGIAQYRIGKESWDHLIKRADKALYTSKNNGRDQWTIANENDKGTISSRSSPRKTAKHDEETNG